MIVGSIVYSAAVTFVCGTDQAEVERRAEATGRTVEQSRLAGPTGTPDEVVEQQLTVATLRNYWRNALQECGFGTQGIMKLARELRGS